MLDPITVSGVVAAIATALIWGYFFWIQSVSGNIDILLHDCDTLRRTPQGEAKNAHDRLVKMGRKALPKLEAVNEQLIREHQECRERFLGGLAAGPSQGFREENHRRMIVEIKQARVVDVINEIERQPFEKKLEVRATSAPVAKALPGGSFRVTLIGTTTHESVELEAALRRAGGPTTIEVICEPSAAAATFPLEAVHAMVFTPTSLRQANAATANAVRAATSPGTCRAYLFVPMGSSPPSGAGLLDDFIQRIPAHDADAVAKEITEFFRDADRLNRHSTLLALRDLFCLNAYYCLGILWPCSYLFAALHVVNAIAVAAKLGPRPEWLGNPFFVTAATFCGAFFIAHCIFVVTRNGLFMLQMVGRLGWEFTLGAVAFGFAAIVTGYSITTLDNSAPRIVAAAVLAASVYLFSMYARRIRAELTSLSALQAAIADPRRRTQVLDAIGRQPLSSNSFPFFSFRSQPLFISYMHDSAWSCETAASIHRLAVKRGLEVFLDQSSIPSGALWRQWLLRAESECGCFIAVLDGEAKVTDWVLAESAYAVMLRKSIGKPRILLVVRAAANIRRSPFGVLYQDLFQAPPGYAVPGAGLLSVIDTTPSAERILQEMDAVPRMGLLK